MPMKTVLVIDDETSICKLIRRILEKKGYRVLEAFNGDQGMKLFNEHHPDLIITDLIMPEKEGLETIREIRKIDADVNFIAISGGGISNPSLYLDFAKKFGAQEIFSKPIDNKDLISAVDRLLKAD